MADSEIGLHVSWRAIETIGNDPVWVITYLHWGDDEERERPGYAGPWPDVHGWYKTEADALKVWRNFRPDSRKHYHVRKAHSRIVE